MKFFLPLVLLLFSFACENPVKNTKAVQQIENSSRALRALNSFRNKISAAHSNNTFWLQVPGENPKKAKHLLFLNSEYASVKEEAGAIIDSANSKSWAEICTETDKLIAVYLEVCKSLDSFDDYENPIVVFELRGNAEENASVLFEKTIQLIDALTDKYYNEQAIAIKELKLSAN
jgi:hypothetical protein